MGQADTRGRSVLVTAEREAGGGTGAGHLAMDTFLSFPVQSCDTVPEAAQVTTTTAVPDSTTTTAFSSPTTSPATTAPPSLDCATLCLGADAGDIRGGCCNPGFCFCSSLSYHVECPPGFLFCPLMEDCVTAHACNSHLDTCCV